MSAGCARVRLHVVGTVIVRVRRVGVWGVCESKFFAAQQECINVTLTACYRSIPVGAARKRIESPI